VRNEFDEMAVVAKGKGFFSIVIEIMMNEGLYYIYVSGGE